MRSIRRLWIVPGIVFVASCNDGPGGLAATVRDSAGITIVESHRAASSGAEALRIEPVPMVQIGTLDGEPEYQFLSIESVARLSSGEVVVADGGSLELRWYDADGRFLHRRGGPGDGPGEYRFIMAAFRLPGDTLLAVDGLTAEARFYDSAGDLVRTWRIHPLSPFNRPVLIGRFIDGHYLVMTERSPPRDERFGHAFWIGALMRYREGGPVDTVAEFTGTERWHAPCGPNNEGVCTLGVPYGAIAAAVVSGAHAVAGNGDSYELRAWTPDRGLVAIYRRTGTAVPLTAERVAQYREGVVARVPAARREQAMALQQTTPIRVTMAAFADIVADDSGRLWVERHTETDSATKPWDVFSTDGHWLGAVDLPRLLRVHQIGADFVAGVVTDEDDVEYVHVYRLVRGG